MSQLTPTEGATPPVTVGESPTMERPSGGTVSAATGSSGNPEGRLPISANGDVGNQVFTPQNTSNMPQQGPISQALTSSAPPPSPSGSGTRRLSEPEPTLPPPAAANQARPKRRSRWNRKKSLFKRPHCGHTTAIPAPEEWISGWLHPEILALIFIVTIGMIGAIAALCHVSREHNGILQVSDFNVTIANYDVGPALAWTALPVFLITLYGMALGAVVTACSDRQPYVDLWSQDRGDGAPLKQSILLDYRIYPKWQQPWEAFKRKHLLLVVGITFASIVQLLLTSLTAHLFNAVIASTSVPSTVTQNTSFNPTGFTQRTDLVPIFDIVSSTLVYGGTPPPWITFSYSMQNFSNPAIPDGNIGTSDYSVETMAYSAELNCSVLDESQYTLAPDGETWQFSGSDRGCSLTSYLQIEGLGSQNFTYYMQSFANVSCGLDAGESRLVVVAGANFNQSLTVLTNISVISCMTAYFNSSGTLDVELDLARSPIPAIQNFAVGSTTLMINPRPEFWNTFESLLHEASINDGTATTSATDFGRLILEYARFIEPQAFLSPDILLNATESIFTAVYAVMSRSYLVQPAAAVDITGTLLISTTRLFVVTPIAYAMIGILCAVCLILIWIFLYARTHKSILYEKPNGLLGSAALLHNSDVGPQVNILRADVTDGQILKSVEKKRHLRDTGWRVERWENPQESRIVMTSAARRPDWKSSFKRNFRKKSSIVSDSPQNL